MPPPLDTSYRGTFHTLHPSCALPPPPRSPLKGNGLPQLETDKVYVSAYLDRLLGVNEDDYRFEVRGRLPIEMLPRCDHVQPG